MTALTADRATPERRSEYISVPVAASTRIFQGSLVATDASGNLVPASASVALTVVGMATEYKDNRDGAAGDLSCRVQFGTFRWANSAAADEITIAHRGRIVYALDDQTVALGEGATGRPVAGVVLDVDSLGVWVTTGLGAVGGGGAAAEGGGTNLLKIRLEDNVGANALVHRYVHSGPPATIRSIRTITDRALTTGDETITAAINGNAVTGGVVTITQSGSAAGDIDLAEPSAANVLEEGDVLTLTVGGTQASTALRVDVTVELAY